MTQNRRPLAEWLLMFCFGVLALGGWQRLVVSFSSWYWLNNAGVTPGPLYLVLSGGLWGLLGLLALVWLLLRRGVYHWLVMAVALLLAVTYWFDRLLISRADGLGANLVFDVLVTLVGLACTALVLRPWRRS